jgi:hypothetical protein
MGPAGQPTPQVVSQSFNNLPCDGGTFSYALIPYAAAMPRPGFIYIRALTVLTVAPQSTSFFTRLCMDNNCSQGGVNIFNSPLESTAAIVDVNAGHTFSLEFRCSSNIPGTTAGGVLQVVSLIW